MEQRGRLTAVLPKLNQSPLVPIRKLVADYFRGAVGGLMGIIEAVRQLRGGLQQRQVPDAQIALVHNEGGILSSHCTAIFGNQPQ